MLTAEPIEDVAHPPADRPAAVLRQVSERHTVVGQHGVHGLAELEWPHQTGHAAWLADCSAINFRGERMRKPKSGVDGVVVLEPGGQLLEDGDGIRPGIYAGIVALKGSNNGLADAFALGAADWQ